MCRVLAYLGPPRALDGLMTVPVNSLINRDIGGAYRHYLQHAGSGFVSWNDGPPLAYRSITPAVLDADLRKTCKGVETTALLAHVRAVPHWERTSIAPENCHPFLYAEYRLALAHNGSLPGWRSMVEDISNSCRRDVLLRLTGSTDTALVYCLLMSQFEDPTAAIEANEIVAGLRRLMLLIRDVKRRLGNGKPAKLKCYLADGNRLTVANLGLGHDGAPTIAGEWDELRAYPVGSREFALSGVVEPAWYLTGNRPQSRNGTYEMDPCDIEDASAVIIASEPLTEDPSRWRRIPFQHVAVFERHDRVLQGRIERLDL